MSQINPNCRYDYVLPMSGQFKPGKSRLSNSSDIYMKIDPLLHSSRGNFIKNDVPSRNTCQPIVEPKKVISRLQNNSQIPKIICSSGEDPLGFTPDMLPLPCAFLRLPWNDSSTYCRLLPNNTDADERSLQYNKLVLQPHNLIVRRMFVERLAKSPSAYMIRYIGSPYTYAIASQRSYDDEQFAHFLMQRSQEMFSSSRIFGLGFSAASTMIIPLQTPYSTSNDCDMCMIYFRLKIYDLPFSRRQLEDDWNQRRYLINDNVSLITVVFDFRFSDITSTLNQGWSLDCMRKIVHLTAQTQSILDSWLVNSLKGRELIIVHLPPPSFSDIVDRAISQQDPSICESGALKNSKEILQSLRVFPPLNEKKNSTQPSSMKENKPQNNSQPIPDASSLKKKIQQTLCCPARSESYFTSDNFSIADTTEHILENMCQFSRYTKPILESKRCVHIYMPEILKKSTSNHTELNLRNTTDTIMCKKPNPIIDTKRQTFHCTRDNDTKNYIEKDDDMVKLDNLINNKKSVYSESYIKKIQADMMKVNNIRRQYQGSQSLLSKNTNKSFHIVQSANNQSNTVPATESPSKHLSEIQNAKKNNSNPQLSQQKFIFQVSPRSNLPDSAIYPKKALFERPSMMCSSSSSKWLQRPKDSYISETLRKII